ncbi:MAG: orotidine 5'-phosphate decarboxylase / HUMPS family protein [Promethearchaeota archaeon]|jgi:bifunctional enzyme Fae/Hps
MNLSKPTILKNPPYIQLAIDIPLISEVRKLFTQLAEITTSQLLIEIGTPFLKNEGLRSVAPFCREYFPNNYLIADLKTLDVGELEVNLGYQTGVNACVVSGLAPIATINNFISECKHSNIDSWVDTLGIPFNEFKIKLKLFKSFPDVLVIHRGIDEEISGKLFTWEIIREYKRIIPSLIAVAGGITLDNIHEPLKNGSDIIIVGRAIYQAENPSSQLNKFIDSLKDDRITKNEIK